MTYDCAVVGGGMAGLTAAAYLSRAGFKVIVLEKQEKVGGLVNSFEHNGFVFDGGIRAFENSGIIFPMLRQLGIDMKLVKNDVSIGIGSSIVNLSSKDSINAYEELLKTVFPGSEKDIRAIVMEISRVMDYMDILYGIDNPLFLDNMKDLKYISGTMLPWLFKYLLTMPKIGRLNMPVSKYLSKFTSNQSLIDMIAQHFFKETPTFFALSYFSLYLDYRYPSGGTATLSRKMEQYILEHGGEIRTGVEICSLEPSKRQIKDTKGQSYAYRKLVWASDMKRLYNVVAIDSISGRAERTKASEVKEGLKGKTGGDSIFTLYLEIDLDKSYFSQKSNPHFFYTPLKQGLEAVLREKGGSDDSSAIDTATVDKRRLFDWVRRYLELTTYEISCPAMRDETMAPERQTGLIVSSLMDYDLVKRARELGCYDEFKAFCEQTIVDVLASSVYPEIKGRIIGQFSSTPLTIERLTGNTDGAITGWAFTNKPIPAVSSLPRVASSVRTPIPNVLQAGQWVFSPSGLPISILTGKLAADRAANELKSSK